MWEVWGAAHSLHTSGAKSVTVMVRMLVGALMGPTTLVGASAFFRMKVVALARPLYVPSGPGLTVACVRVLPRRFLLDKASLAVSSYQLLDLVASLELVIVVLRSAVYLVGLTSAVEAWRPVDAAVMTPVFCFCRLILWPDSSSADE